MFCGNCGHQNEDNMAFCSECGSPLTVTEQPQTQFQPQPVAAAAGPSFMTGLLNEKNKKIGIFALAAAALALLIFLLVNSFGGRSYKSTVDKYLKYSFNGNAKGIVSLIPKDFLNTALKNTNRDKSELVEYLQETLGDSRESIEDEFGKGAKMTYKIEDVEDVTGYELDKLKDQYEMFDLKISAAKKVETNIKIKGSKSEDEDTAVIPLIKVGRSWYLDVFNLSIF
ncbi:MAG: zinc ribbon domain-containing protein [Clostridia bacterium]|nr:zinc ribbon domain-containing protein [Clostridia bacterium]